MRYRLQRHDGTDCSATMVPFTVLRMVPIQRYRHSHMVKYKKPIQKWTPEARAIAAKQCKTRTEFHKKYPWAHHLASLNEGELDRICEHMVKPKR